MTFTARQVLTAAQLNDLSIDTLTTTGDVTVGGTLTATIGAAGSDGQVQYNNGGSFGGASSLYYDDVNQRVGIGLSNPQYALDVYGQVRVGDGTNISPNPDGLGHLMIQGSAYTGFATLDGTAMSVGHNSSIRRLDLMTDETARLTIAGSGNVGIGTTTPTAALSFANVTGNKIDLYHNTSGSGDRYGIQVQSSELRIHSGASGAGTGGITLGKSSTGTFTEHVRITNDGNVGIGDSTPSYKLDVNGDARIVSQLNLNSNLDIRPTSGQLSVNFHHASAGSFWHLSGPRTTDSDALHLYWYNGSSYSLVADWATNGGVTFSGAITASGGINGLTLSNGISGSNFDITGVNQMTINDEGEGILFPNVSLYQEPGDTDRLTLNGELWLKKSGAPFITFQDTNSSDANGYLQFVNNAGTFMGLIGYGNNDDIHIRNDNSGGNIFFRTNAIWRAYFSSTGHFLPYADNTYDFGNNGARWRFLYCSQGIRFNNTAGSVASIAMSGNELYFYSDNHVYMVESDAGSVEWDARMNNNGASYNDAGVWGNLSDDRAKEYIDTPSYVDDVLRLPVRKYRLVKSFRRSRDDDMNPVTEIVDRTRPIEALGFSAQETEQIIPGLVDTDEWGVKSMKATVLIPMLVQVVQSLNERLSALESVA